MEEENKGTENRAVVEEGGAEKGKWSTGFVIIENVVIICLAFFIMLFMSGSNFVSQNVSEPKAYSTFKQNESSLYYKLGSISINEDAQDGEDFVFITQKSSHKYDGKITSVAPVEVDGNTYYYFTCADSEKIFISSIKNNATQPFLLMGGTEVSFEYYDSDEEENVGIVTEINFGIGIKTIYERIYGTEDL